MSPSSNMKFCKDCRHSAANRYSEISDWDAIRCEKFVETHPVSGHEVWQHTCIHARTQISLCGTDAKYFVERDENKMT